MILESQKRFALVTGDTAYIWPHLPKFKNSRCALSFGKHYMYNKIKKRVALVARYFIYEILWYEFRDFSQFINEMIGELFIPHDMPEPPKESFFKGLFGGGARSLDREELCMFDC